MLVGVLSARFAKAKKAFSFEYDKEWLKLDAFRLLDPDIEFYSGSDSDNNALNFDLARSVGEYFRLPEKEMNEIIEQVLASVSYWRKIATKIDIPDNVS